MAAPLDSFGDWDDSGDPIAAAGTFALICSTNITAGSIIHCAINYDIDQTVTVTDTLGNTYSAIGSNWDAGESIGGTHWQAYSSSGGANTITFAFPGGRGGGVKAAYSEIPGRASASPVAGSSVDAKFYNDTATDAVTSGSFTPSEDNCNVSTIFLPNSGVTTSAGTGFTLDWNADRTVVGWDDQTTAAAVGGMFTIASTTVGVAFCAAFKQASAGGAVVPILLSQYRLRNI